MTKTISASELRARIRSVLNEVGYRRVDYVVEKFGEPVAAVVSMDDFRLLQGIKTAPAVAAPTASAFERELAAIRNLLTAEGYQPRTREEIDAEIRAERASWDD